MKPNTPNPSSALYRVRLNKSLELIHPEGIPVIVVPGSEPRAYLDNCPDEALPLQPVLKAGCIVCTQHGARFNACTGCLAHAGAAHHVDRCQEGLLPIAAVNLEDGSIEIEITPVVRQIWAETLRRRERRRHGRGPLGFIRHALATLHGTPNR